MFSSANKAEDYIDKIVQQQVSDERKKRDLVVLIQEQDGGRMLLTDYLKHAGRKK